MLPTFSGLTGVRCCVTNEECWIVYCCAHMESGRRYVGLTKKTLRQRWNAHLYNAFNRKLGSHSHFWNAIRKYGKDAFDLEVLEVCSTLEDANAAEERWIIHFDTRNPEKGFNLARGGGCRPNPERKNPWRDPAYKWHDPGYRASHGEKMREVVNRPEVRAKLEAAQAIFTKDPSWLAKVSRIGVPLSQKHRESLAESTSKVRRKVPGHVSCGRHGLVPFADCFRAKSNTGRILHRCKHCILDRAKCKRFRSDAVRSP